MTNVEIARVFEQIATALEIDGGNPFRIRAYQEAARIIEGHPEPMAALTAEPGKLEEIRGIGKDLAQKIRDVVGTGTTALRDELTAKYPPGLLALTAIQGLGAKRVKVLFESLGVRNREDLERVARAGQVRELPKFGETIERNILAGLAAMRGSEEGERLLLAAAWAVAHELADAIRRVPGVRQVEPAGSFRRRRETVGDLDLLVSGGDPERVMDALTRHAYVAEVLARGETKSSVRLASGLQVDLRLVPPESFGAALLYFTGSKAHNIELRKLAIEKGWSLNEYGLTRGEKVIAGRTEEDLYRALGLAWIPPEMRESRGEIELARADQLPRLIELEDLRADLHVHTDRSDGIESLETMVRSARDRGYEYVAITEHSKVLAMAQGFDGARVRQSVDEIAQVRKQVPGIEVLHGLEVDILVDGTLDLDDESLSLLDWVIVSLHSRLDQPPDVITERVLRALSHPRVHAFGHPTGRRIGSREPARFDLEKVFARAAECSVAMEINSQPDRSDLSDVNARLALDRGLSLVIDTDAHSIPQLDFSRYGVFAARRAWATRERVLNARDYASFRAWLDARRSGNSVKVPTPPRAAASPAPSSKPVPRSKPVPSTKPAPGTKPVARANPAVRTKPAPRTKPSPRPKAGGRVRAGAGARTRAASAPRKRTRRGSS